MKGAPPELCNSNFLWNGRHHTLEQNWDGFSFVSFPCFWHFASYTQPLIQARNFFPSDLSSVSCYGVPASQLPITRNCGVPTIQLLAAHKTTSQQCFLCGKVWRRRMKPLISLPLSPFPFFSFFLNSSNSIVTVVGIRTSPSGLLDLSGVTVTYFGPNSLDHS